MTLLSFELPTYSLEGCRPIWLTPNPLVQRELRVSRLGYGSLNQ